MSIDSKQSKQASKFWWGIIIGTAAGVGTVALLKTKKGKKIRKVIQRNWDKIEPQLSEFQKKVENGEEIKNEAKDLLENVVSQVGGEVKEILKVDSTKKKKSPRSSKKSESSTKASNKEKSSRRVRRKPRTKRTRFFKGV